MVLINTLSEERSSFGSSTLCVDKDYKAKKTCSTEQKPLDNVRCTPCDFLFCFVLEIAVFFELVLFDSGNLSTVRPQNATRQQLTVNLREAGSKRGYGSFCDKGVFANRLQRL